jgi:GNAT superfamily N-acetyltransferase
VRRRVRGDLYATNSIRPYLGRGIGYRLHAAALDRMPATSPKRGLRILDGNQRAMRFYLRQGWTDTGRTQIDRGPDDIELHERRLHRALITPAET